MGWKAENGLEQNIKMPKMEWLIGGGGDLDPSNAWQLGNIFNREIN